MPGVCRPPSRHQRYIAFREPEYHIYGEESIITDRPWHPRHRRTERRRRRSRGAGFRRGVEKKRIKILHPLHRFPFVCSEPTEKVASQSPPQKYIPIWSGVLCRQQVCGVCQAACLPACLPRLTPPSQHSQSLLLWRFLLLHPLDSSFLLYPEYNSVAFARRNLGKASLTPPGILRLQKTRVCLCLHPVLCQWLGGTSLLMLTSYHIKAPPSFILDFSSLLSI